MSICQGEDNDWKWLSISFTQRETGTGAQLLRKINGAARCRDSGEGDQPMVLFTKLGEDKAAVEGAKGQTQAGVLILQRITWQQWEKNTKGWLAEGV